MYLGGGDEEKNLSEIKGCCISITSYAIDKEPGDKTEQRKAADERSDNFECARIHDGFVEEAEVRRGILDRIFQKWLLQRRKCEVEYLFIRRNRYCKRSSLRRLTCRLFNLSLEKGGY